MARKKEYAAEDGNSKKRSNDQQPPPPGDANYNKPDNASWKQKNAKRRDQTSAAGSSGRDVYDVADLRAQLGSFGLTLRDIPGDGNCLFRALGDQLDGHSMNHIKHRMDTVRYMIAHRGHFEPFVDVPFDRYMDNLSRPGTYAGQDALVAFARLHQVNIVIHQLNSPLWQIEGCEVSPHGGSVPELHLSYHNGEHYSSVRRFGDIADTPAHIQIVSQITGATEVPCCASHGSVCTPSSPVTSHISSFSCSQPPYMQSPINSSPHPVPVPPSEPPEANESSYIHNEDEFLLLVEEVMLRSGCSDSVMATDALVDNGGDVEQTISYLVSLALILKPLADDEQITNPVRSERNSIEKDVIREVLPVRRISNRRSVGEEAAERRQNSRAQISRSRPKDKSMVISPGSMEKKSRKSNKGGAKGVVDHQQQRDAAIERDLRFLTL